MNAVSEVRAINDTHARSLTWSHPSDDGWSRTCHREPISIFATC